MPLLARICLITCLLVVAARDVAAQNLQKNDRPKPFVPLREPSPSDLNRTEALRLYAGAREMAASASQ